MNKNVRMLSIGAATQDVFLRAKTAFKPWRHKGVYYERLPLGAKLEVEEVIFSTGGGACNAAVTFARLGMHSQFMGTIADDVAGRAVLTQLDHENIDTAHVSYDDKHSTGYSTLLLAPNGERTVLVHRGASEHYDKRNFDLSKVEADWLYISSMGGAMEVLEAVVTRARERGIKVACNPGSGELKQAPKLKALLDDIDILSINRDEAKLLFEGETSEELAMHALHRCPAVIVSDGPNGAVAATKDKVVIAGMYEDVPVIDRTGAGDAFGSGFAAHIAMGRTLEEAIVYASANSTSVVQKIGAKDGILHAGARLHHMPLKVKVLQT